MSSAIERKFCFYVGSDPRMSVSAWDEITVSKGKDLTLKLGIENLVYFGNPRSSLDDIELFISLSKKVGLEIDYITLTAFDDALVRKIKGNSFLRNTFVAVRCCFGLDFSDSKSVESLLDAGADLVDLRVSPWSLGYFSKELKSLSQLDISRLLFGPELELAWDENEIIFLNQLLEQWIKEQDSELDLKNWINTLRFKAFYEERSVYPTLIADGNVYLGYEAAEEYNSPHLVLGNLYSNKDLQDKIQSAFNNHPTKNKFCEMCIFSTSCPHQDTKKSHRFNGTLTFPSMMGCFSFQKVILDSLKAGRRIMTNNSEDSGLLELVINGDGEIFTVPKNILQGNKVGQFRPVSPSNNIGPTAITIENKSVGRPASPEIKIQTTSSEVTL